MLVTVDVRSLLPVRWKRNLAVGAEHLVHTDERASRLATVLSSNQSHGSGVLLHSIPAGREEQLIEIETEAESDDFIEVRVRLVHDFLARAPNGNLIFGLRSESVPDESLKARIPVSSTNSEDSVSSDRFYLLLGQRAVSVDPDQDRPDGALEVSYEGALGRQLTLAYPGLADPVAVRPLDGKKAPGAYADRVSLGLVLVHGREIGMEKKWIPPMAIFELGDRVLRDSLARFRRRLDDLVGEASLRVMDPPRDVGALYQRGEMARHELLAFLRNLSLAGDIGSLSATQLWAGIVLPLSAWLESHGTPADVSEGTERLGEEPAWGLVGASEVLDRAGSFVEFLVNRRPWS